MKCLKFIFLGLVLVSTVGCSSIYYFPQKRELVHRDKLPLKPEDIYFKSQDGTKLHGWHFRALGNRGPKAVVVQFHGNAQNLSTHFLALYEAPSKNIAYMIFDYRGYGKSEGHPEPKGVVEDGVAAIRWASEKYPGTPLIIFGQSLGGAIAFRSVSRIKDEIPISLFVADSTFADYRRAARTIAANSVMAFLFQFLAWSLVDNSETPFDDIPAISPIPLIVVHGTKDRIIKESLGQEVYALAKEPKEYWSIPDAQHMEFMFKNEGQYAQKFYDKVDEIVRNQKVTRFKSEKLLRKIKPTSKREITQVIKSTANAKVVLPLETF